MPDEPASAPGELGQDHLPLDAHDARVLAALRRALDHADPVPMGLVERMTFAVSVEEMMDEVARLQREERPLDSGVRGGDDHPGTQTMSFSSDRASITVTVSTAGRGRVRIDGWLLGGEGAIVSLRIPGATRRAATRSGRFWFDDVPRGSVQLVVEDLDGGSIIVTPSVDL